MTLILLLALRSAWRKARAPLLAALVTLLAWATPASAQYAGLRTLVVPGAEPVTVALFYPTPAVARTVPMGPWRPVVTPGAPVAAAPLKGLVLISHGTGGHELGHHNLATRLAADGYLVAALRHPGDNWEDRSMITSGRYFSERPRQVSRVLDALLASPEWGPRIPAGRIGAVGHSAGGYTVLALAGAQAEPTRAAQHCRSVSDDPGFCSLGQLPAGGQAAQAPQKALAAAAPAPAASVPTQAGAAALDGPRVSVADPRIRAVVAMAPMAVVFTPESLKAISVPVRLMVAERDAVLTGKYHGGYVAANLPSAPASTVPGAGHFAFMAQSVWPLASDAGDAAANPEGFDRVAYHPTLENEVAEFLARQWR
ncbi:serine aminopeptidase domain-containing protein [Acidovorax sp. 69]|uniref:alpha/beta hydrolase family protein n=1 Tax=Acidovorax sp. 69 TaxID=2035202 RepID=UPI001E3DB6C5|nr:alpha/beta hydrolase [Acidovorax sp. 69]